jgi:hypothetical protein
MFVKNDRVRLIKDFMPYRAWDIKMLEIEPTVIPHGIIGIVFCDGGYPDTTYVTFEELSIAVPNSSLEKIE